MKILFWILFGLTYATHCLAAPFINLDFENVDLEGTGIPPLLGGGGKVEKLMPGWQIKGLQDDTIGLNAGCVEEFPCTMLVSPSGFVLSDPAMFFLKGLHGNYGLGIRPTPDFSYTLSQRGDVPPDANYIAVDAQISRSAYLGVFFDGKLVLGQSEHQTNNASDISTYAGKTVNLEILAGSNNLAPASVPAVPPIPSTVGLDGIAFLHLATPALNVTNILLSTNGFTFSWQAETTARFQPEFTTNLPPVWQTLGSVVTSTNGNFTFTDTSVRTNNTLTQRFYRLRSLPP